MGRQPRTATGGVTYHVMNRAHARIRMFDTHHDYHLFENLIGEAKSKFPTEVLAYCIMPNHWHLLLRPRGDGELSAYMQWLTNTHTRRFHKLNRTQGDGAIYMGRYRSIVIESERHLWVAWRYVERNALTAGLVERACDWRWSSGWWRMQRPDDAAWLLAEGLDPDAKRWSEVVDQPMTETELGLESGLTWNH